MMINKPKMILFDYGQTLIDEEMFDGVKGTEAVLRFAIKNEYSRTAQEVQAVADAINSELGRFDPNKRHLLQVEIPNSIFTKYLYESLKIELSIDGDRLDTIFWDAASPGILTEGVDNFLEFLRNKKIRTGVISNISYSGNALINRIKSVIPAHRFEFVIASSEYLFRKPNKKIFELALEKAGLNAEDVWYIGDQYECDIVGAKNAGIFPVWYLGASRAKCEEKKDVLTIFHWDELKKML